MRASCPKCETSYNITNTMPDTCQGTIICYVCDEAFKVSKKKNPDLTIDVYTAPRDNPENILPVLCWKEKKSITISVEPETVETEVEVLEIKEHSLPEVVVKEETTQEIAEEVPTPEAVIVEPEKPKKTSLIKKLLQFIGL